MKRSALVGVIGLVVILAVTTACSGTGSSPGASGAASAGTSPDPPPATTTPAPTETPAPSAAPTPDAAAATPAPLFLGSPGRYHVGTRTIAARDADRDDRPVSITVWYPAVAPEDANPWWPTPEATPDPAGAPYPLLLSSTKMANLLAPYLVSRGFAWASVDGIDTYPWMDEEAFQQPLDILFALDDIAARPPAGLEGLVDTERAGAIGYSFDGFNTLAMSGARIDPAYFQAQCPTPDATTAAVLGGRLSSFTCDLADRWDAFAARMGETITTSAGGLWQPLTNPRIRAVMPLAAEGWWLFGERGLAAVDRPTLMLVGTADELYSENVLLFEHLGAPDRTLISFVGQNHMALVSDRAHVARLAHFAAAFFGHHLQGRDGLAWYYSEAFVDQHEDLAWGASTGQ
jgi:predicted dienelactone hydrolase